MNLLNDSKTNFPSILEAAQELPEYERTALASILIASTLNPKPMQDIATYIDVAAAIKELDHE